MNKLLYKIVGWIIKRSRLSDGITQQEYAEQRNVEWELIIRLEEGRPRPKNYMLMLDNSDLELRFI